MKERNTPLKNSCRIRTGQTFKGALEGYTKGNIKVLQPRDLPDDRDGKPGAQTIAVAAKKVPMLHKHLLQPGEILVMNKGSRFPVFLYQKEYGDMVATSAFYVLTPGTGLLPEFLYWYLCRPETKIYFKNNLKGSTVPSITKDVLGKLPLPNLGMADQKHICAFSEALWKEEKLLHSLLEERAVFGRRYCQEYIEQCIA